MHQCVALNLSQCSTVVLTLLQGRTAIPSYAEEQNREYQNFETPEPIVTKFGMGDYVGDMTTNSNRSTQCGVPANE